MAAKKESIGARRGRGSTLSYAHIEPRPDLRAAVRGTWGGVVSVAVYLLEHLFDDNFYSLLSLTIFICFDLFIDVYLFIVEINCTDEVDVWNTISFLCDA